MTNYRKNGYGDNSLLADLNVKKLVGNTITKLILSTY